MPQQGFNIGEIFIPSARRAQIYRQGQRDEMADRRAARDYDLRLRQFQFDQEMRRATQRREQEAARIAAEENRRKAEEFEWERRKIDAQAQARDANKRTAEALGPIVEGIFAPQLTPQTPGADLVSETFFGAPSSTPPRMVPGGAPVDQATRAALGSPVAPPGTAGPAAMPPIRMASVTPVMDIAPPPALAAQDAASIEGVENLRAAIEAASGSAGYQDDPTKYLAGIAQFLAGAQGLDENVMRQIAGMSGDPAASAAYTQREIVRREKPDELTVKNYTFVDEDGNVVTRQTADSGLTEYGTGRPLPRGGALNARIAPKEGAGMGGLTTSAQTELQKGDMAANQTITTLNMLKETIGPGNVGGIADFRRLIKGLVGQAGEFATALTRMNRQAEADVIQGMQQGTVDASVQSYLFDPSLDEVETLARVAAFNVARSLQGTGVLSDRDVAEARTALGIDSVLATPGSASNKIDVLIELTRRNRLSVNPDYQYNDPTAAPIEAPPEIVPAPPPTDEQVKLIMQDAPPQLRDILNAVVDGTATEQQVERLVRAIEVNVLSNQQVDAIIPYLESGGF